MHDAETAAIKAALRADAAFLGEGQYGIMFRVDQGGDVSALKLFKDPYDLGRSEREIESLSLISSRNVVRFVDEGYIDIDGRKRRYFRTEFVDGETLEDRIARIGKLDKGDLLDLAAQVAQGLDALQLRKIVHRDLKPANIIMEKTGRIVIVDLGLGKRLGAVRLTGSDVFIGTGLYAAPEQFGYAAHVDIRADIFSLGVILYEAATGSGAHPFGCDENMSLAQIRDRILTGRPKPHPLASFRIISDSMLQSKPFRRMKSPGNLLGELGEIK